MKHIPMRMIILEGIAGAGKTTVRHLLLSQLVSSVAISENETLWPLIDNRDPEIANRFLEALLPVFRRQSAENVIVDRLHLTHAFRTHTSLEPFAHFEHALQAIADPLLVLLTVDPEQIKQRLEETMLFRKDTWNKGAQGTIEERVAYYQEQQTRLLQLRTESRLETLAINTTDKNWDRCAASIITHL